MVLEGKSVFRGIAIGKIKMLAKKENVVTRKSIIDCEAELARYEQAKQTAMELTI